MAFNLPYNFIMHNYDVNNPASMTVEELLHTYFGGIVSPSVLCTCFINYSIFQKNHLRTKSIYPCYVMSNSNTGYQNISH